MNENFNLKEELKKLPARPGVYLMHNAADDIIYVGKAVNLKNRVTQYFQKGHRRSPKIERMITLIDRFEYIVVDSEMEALILECNLIKEYRPKYNTMLMDDKTYPYIKVTTNEAYPRILLARRVSKDNASYFGPYTNGVDVKDIISLTQKLFNIRQCNKQITGERAGLNRPCLYHHMKQCGAPCCGEISKEDYEANVARLMDFLKGNYGPVAKELEAKMAEASANLEFEEAAVLRDRLKSVNALAQRQKVTVTDEANRDIIAYAIMGDEAIVQVFYMRQGKILGREHFHLNGVEFESGSSILADFIMQYYQGAPEIPRELLLCDEVDEAELLEDWLSERRGQRVKISVPQRGDKSRLVELAKKNARMVLEQDAEKIKREEARTRDAIREICGLIGIDYAKRIESYDISNISGFESVGSMVVYEDGRPKKNDYRKFRIKSVVGPDDYASMREVLTRRFTHNDAEARKKTGYAESESDASRVKDEGVFWDIPDLILMDGGRGQVNVALDVLSGLGIDICVCGMVKDDNHRTRGLYFENREIPIDTSGEGFKLITRIQDETHRFAIEYHRSLRTRNQVHSILDDIDGVGEKRRRALMKHFVSLEALKAADVEELAAVETMNSLSARKVYDFFHGEAKDSENE